MLFELAKNLIYNHYREPGESPKLHLFGQMKSICRQWIDGGCLKCVGGTYPAQLLYPELSDLACEKIKAAISAAPQSTARPIMAVLDAYNPTGSTNFVNFNTSKELRWQADPQRATSTGSSVTVIGRSSSPVSLNPIPG